jgi:hypothetical protein
MSARPFTVVECDQRSEAWKAARLGRLTGSRAADAFHRNKDKKFSANRKDLRIALALERITGIIQDDRGSSRLMRDGIAREPLNRFAYECATGQLVTECGFLADNDSQIGVSLDGYIGDFEGLVECKSPKEATHLETLTQYRAWVAQRDSAATEAARAPFDAIGEDYMWQIIHALYCTGASWCDYVSYHPAFPEAARLVIIRVMREDCDLAGYEVLVREFLAEVDAEVEKVLAA